MPQQKQPITLVLASQSPRRRELLKLGGFAFETCSADIDETEYESEAPDVYTLRVSKEKALAVTENVSKGSIIITADTTVADGQQILGKPQDAKQAQQMLTQLRGRSHQVYTAITLLNTATNEIKQDIAVTDVYMRDYSKAEIEAYIKSGDPFDKAGSYAIQNAAFSPVAQINGCYANVVGLPMCHLLRQLQQWGIQATEDIPTACQGKHKIDCPVYEDILANQ